MNILEYTMIIVAAFVIGMAVGIMFKDSDWKNIIQSKAGKNQAEHVRGKWYTFKEE